jgi:hypothetical protein
MDFDSEISNASIQAAADLEIRVAAPFTFTAIDGESILFEAPILDFGGTKGLVVGNKDSENSGARMAGGYAKLYPRYRRSRSPAVHRHIK